MQALQELVLTVCLMATPAHCEERRVAFDYESGPLACMMSGHMLVPQWEAVHPKWRVEHWACAAPGMKPVRA